MLDVVTKNASCALVREAGLSYLLRTICHCVVKLLSPQLCPRASLVAQIVKNLPARQETRVWSLGREDLWKREWLSPPVFLPGEFHGQEPSRATVHGVSESDTTEWPKLGSPARSHHRANRWHRERNSWWGQLHSSTALNFLLDIKALLVGMSRL